jgi:hypothetical protein
MALGAAEDVGMAAECGLLWADQATPDLPLWKPLTIIEGFSANCITRIVG